MIIKKKIVFIIIGFLTTLLFGFIFSVFINEREIINESSLDFLIIAALVLYFCFIEFVRYIFYKYWPIQDIGIENRSHDTTSRSIELPEFNLPKINKNLLEKFDINKAVIAIKSVIGINDHISVSPHNFPLTEEVLSYLKRLRDKFGSIILSKEIPEKYTLEYKKLCSWDIHAIIYIEGKELFRGFVLVGQKKNAILWNREDKDRLSHLQKYLENIINQIVSHQLAVNRIRKYK